MYGMKEEVASNLEFMVSKLFECNRYGVSGLVDADLFRTNPMYAGIMVVSFIYARRYEMSQIQYKDFLSKYEIIFNSSDKDYSEDEMNDYFIELENIVRIYLVKFYGIDESMCGMKDDIVSHLEYMISKLFGCNRYGVSGLVDADVFRANPMYAGIMVVSFIYARKYEISEIQYKDFLSKYKKIFNSPDKDCSDRVMYDYLMDLADIARIFIK